MAWWSLAKEKRTTRLCYFAANASETAGAHVLLISCAARRWAVTAVSRSDCANTIAHSAMAAVAASLELHLLACVAGVGSLPSVDIAVDPLDGTTACATGKPGAVAVIALAERGALFDPGPAFYMNKLAVGPEAAEAIDIR